MNKCNTCKNLVSVQPIIGLSPCFECLSISTSKGLIYRNYQPRSIKDVYQQSVDDIGTLVSEDKEILRGDEKVRAKITIDKYGADFMTMQNGWQWSGSGMSPKLARLSIEVLHEYLESVDDPIVDFCDQDEAEMGIGKWLSAALDDDNVCVEMKLDIVKWFTYIENKPHNDLIVEVVKSLERLVSLKHFKDTYGKTEKYNELQPKAWLQAKDALKQIKKDI